ncbi:hypothetical protein AVEN_120812-1 [Araneus ventricosus]|uniref:Uncharacterized protein n=1 Tax=Araneus ventricosus TaxID=182803 RepID=A0A4Y2FA98_ARAVE|nr:hypothetical protein AVEN_120812-1 [Araneus ventricosus]
MQPVDGVSYTVAEAFAETWSAIEDYYFYTYSIQKQSRKSEGVFLELLLLYLAHGGAGGRRIEFAEGALLVCMGKGKWSQSSVPVPNALRKLNLDLELLLNSSSFHFWKACFAEDEFLLSLREWSLDESSFPLSGFCFYNESVWAYDNNSYSVSIRHILQSYKKLWLKT